MPRPRQVSDEAILGAVRAAVVDQGPHVSLDIIAGSLGVTAPALFRRFHSRNDLLIAALRPEASPPFLDYIAAGPDARPIHEQLVELFTRIGTFFAGAIPCLTALRESGIPLESLYKSDQAPPLRAVRALSGWLERARARGLIAVADAQSTAVAVLGALQAPPFFRHLAKTRGVWDARGFAKELAQLLLCGLSRPPGRRATARPSRASRGVRPPVPRPLRPKERS